MHPVMFRIPLPTTSNGWVILFFVVAGVVGLFALYEAFVAKNRAIGLVSGIGAAGVVAARFVLRAWVDGAHASEFPIYSYGVMLGLSLVVGWFLTLGLAERDGLPREQMGDCYVDTAIMALVGSRVLYVVTNLDQFKSFWDVFSMRSGGLVAYGGFLGGFLGSYLYLKFGIGFLSTFKRVTSGDSEPWRPLPILPWADVAVPSLASGLMVTRIGCYLFGCDFGKELPPTAPPWLKTLGTFPHWSDKLLESQSGSPAYLQHLALHKVTESATALLPVHPTQIYESLVGGGLCVLMLLARRNQKFRGQIFFLFFFAYGICRYLLEVLRDDNERGSLPFTMPAHVLIPVGLAIFAFGWCIGFSQLVHNVGLRRVTQVASFAPAVVWYAMTKPELFAQLPEESWSTSQAIALVTGMLGCVGFNVLYKTALAHPQRAMDLGLPPPPREKDEGAKERDDEEDEDDDEEDEGDKASSRRKRRKAADKPVKRAPKPSAGAAKKKAEPEEEPAEAEDDAPAHDDEG